MATDQEMQKLKQAIADGKRVEIDRHTAHPSADPQVASRSAQKASERNARDERIARIRNADGSRTFECGVSREQAFELLDAGATPNHPGDQATA